MCRCAYPRGPLVEAWWGGGHIGAEVCVMAEMRESSVLFSLNQLMSLEQQRIQEEEEAAKRKLEMEASARMEAERAVRVEQEARIQAEEARRQAEERARREEAAKLEAMRLAEIEGARIAAEQRARIAMMEQAQKHERDLAALEGDGQKKRLKRALVFGGLFAVALFAAAGGVYFGKIKPEAERATLEQQAKLASIEEALAKAKIDAERTDQKMKDAQAAVERAQSEAERIKAEQALAAATRAKDDAQKTLQRVQPPKKTGPDCIPCKYPGDPLCTCL